MTEEEKRAARAADAERKRKRRKENSAETREHARKENRLQQQACRRVADEEVKKGIREYDRLYRQDRRQAEVGYSSHRILGPSVRQSLFQKKKNWNFKTYDNK